MAVTGNNIGEGGDYSGLYTPTPVNAVNCTPLIYECMFDVRDGFLVISGRVDMNVTTGGANTNFSIELPVSSDFSSSTDMGGSAVFRNQNVMTITIDATNDLIKFYGNPLTTGNSVGSFYLMCRIK